MPHIDKSAKRQVQLGKRLACEKQLCFATGGTWKTYVKEYFGLSRERADELIRIGRGALTVIEARAAKRESTRAFRLRLDHSIAAARLMSSLDRADNLCTKICERRRQIPKDELQEIDAAIKKTTNNWVKLVLEISKPR